MNNNSMNIIVPNYFSKEMEFFLKITKKAVLVTPVGERWLPHNDRAEDSFFRVANKYTGSFHYITKKDRKYAIEEYERMIKLHERELEEMRFIHRILKRRTFKKVIVEPLRKDKHLSFEDYKDAVIDFGDDIGWSFFFTKNKSTGAVELCSTANNVERSVMWFSGDYVFQNKDWTAELQWLKKKVMGL